MTGRAKRLVHARGVARTAKTGHTLSRWSHRRTVRWPSVPVLKMLPLLCRLKSW